MAEVGQVGQQGNRSRAGWNAGDPCTCLVVARGLRAFVDGLRGIGLPVLGGLRAVHRLRLTGVARLGLEWSHGLGRVKETVPVARAGSRPRPHGQERHADHSQSRLRRDRHGDGEASPAHTPRTPGP